MLTRGLQVGPTGSNSDETSRCHKRQYVENGAGLNCGFGVLSGDSGRSGDDAGGF